MVFANLEHGDKFIVVSPYSSETLYQKIEMNEGQSKLLVSFVSEDGTNRGETSVNTYCPNTCVFSFTKPDVEVKRIYT